MTRSLAGRFQHPCWPGRGRIGALMLLALGASSFGGLLAAGEATIVRHRLSNGATLVAVSDPRWPLVHLEIRITPGALADPAGQPGAAALTAATLMESAVGGRRLSDVLDDYGTEVTVQPTWKEVRITAQCLSPVFPEVFKAIATALTRPSFAAEPLSRARDGLMVRLRSEAQRNAATADREFRYLLYQGERLGDPSVGTQLGLSGLSPQHVSAFYDRHYYGSGLTVLVAGHFDLIAVKRMAEEEFGRLRARPAAWRDVAPTRDAEAIRQSDTTTSTVKGGFTWFIERDITPPQVRLGQIVPDHAPEDDVLAKMLNHIFGGAVNSRLMKIFREQRAMTYGIGSVLPEKDATDPFMIWTFTEGPKLRAMIKGLRVEVARLRDEPVSADELNAARQALRNQFLYAFETAPGVGSLALEYPGVGIEQMKREYLASLEAVTPARLHWLARALIDSENLNLLVVGRAAEVTPVLEQLGDYHKMPSTF